jgi:hypothetical protein
MNARVALKLLLPLVAGVIISCAGCSDKSAGDHATARRAETPASSAARPPPEKPFDPLGTWTVAGHSIPGISAVSEDEATAHDGQIVQLDPMQALSNGERCVAPGYPARSVDTEDYLASEFNLPPESLQALAGKDHVTIVEISCDGGPWTAFGSLLIVIDANRALTPWDGAFYELQRTPPAG